MLHRDCHLKHTFQYTELHVGVLCSVLFVTKARSCGSSTDRILFIAAVDL